MHSLVMKLQPETFVEWDRRVSSSSASSNYFTSRLNYYDEQIDLDKSIFGPRKFKVYGKSHKSINEKDIYFQIKMSIPRTPKRENSLRSTVSTRSLTSINSFKESISERNKWINKLIKTTNQKQVYPISVVPKLRAWPHRGPIESEGDANLRKILKLN
ncbi:hypothetical protein A3Q56_05666 [Intoshia linei]|uniref:Uncharacterized protein n=1 Tax=Intoshia linei TaxID=1819745 RepID=A0A177AXA2_9BILA|nr:hypothetical protein A3Q56_05666 [Intoshia linei]